MTVNRGKDFESKIKAAFEKVDGVSIDRLHDQTTGYLGSANICDFIVYREPNEIYIECKSIHGNTFPFLNLTDKQYQGLLEKSQIEGVYAGVIVWWVDKDVTKFIPIQTIKELKVYDYKSIRYDAGLPEDLLVDEYFMIPITGKKKRIFFDYDMEAFLNEIQSDR